MNYLTSHTDFKDLLTQASQKIGLPVAIIEKDYWVTRVLRELANSEFTYEFIFKGGTSLSKIWFEDFGRFSEDIDILLLENASSNSVRKKSNRLSNLVDFTNLIEGLSLNTETSTNFSRKPIAGKFYFSYNGIHNKDLPEYIKNEIFLEPGYRGGSFPVSKKEMNSFLGNIILDACGSELPEDFLTYEQDILPFSLNVLNPERIFLEKLDAIKNAFTRGKLMAATRHYYDLYYLINLEEVNSLKTDKEKLDEILQDISDYSKKYFGINEDLTVESLKECRAFSIDYPEFYELEKRYKSERDLYYKEQPDFKDIVLKIKKYLEAL